jgi:hypothetical protein
MINLDNLLRRIQDRIPEKYHDVLKEEFYTYQNEISRMSEQKDKIGQASLTDREIKKLPMGNQHTQWNTIRWQAVKGAAIHYNVNDWTKKVDPTLTYEENIELMRKNGDSETMREMEQYR